MIGLRRLVDFGYIERKNMNCILCKKPIHNYHTEFNHLKIDESHAADICSECIGKFVKWQQSIYAKLFPTKLQKRGMEKLT